MGIGSNASRLTNEALETPLLLSSSLLLLFISEERYSVLHSGELIVHRTNMADTERTYRCRIRNTVSGDTVLSSNTGRAIVIGKRSSFPSAAAHFVISDAPGYYSAQSPCVRLNKLRHR